LHGTMLAEPLVLNRFAAIRMLPTRGATSTGW
jgi:hypothetical protein